jgi:PAS domain S-box-containing protein
MASNDDQSANTSAQELQRRVNERFGVLPNFFRISPETPEITEKLWGFAQAAYLDNPLPSVFKERLFVRLSRFCAARYCIARHTGFLIGLGRPAGDKYAQAENVENVVKLLRRPLARGPELASCLSFCSGCPAPLVDMPTAGTQMEDGLFSLASHVFLQTADAPKCLDGLEWLLGAVRLQYLLLFLAFVRAAHYWTKVHPDIQFEDDIKQLLATHEALANCILDDPEALTEKVTQSILDELPALRLKADKAIGLLASIVDSSDDAMVSKTLDGIITSWNQSAERMFGYRESEVIGQHINLVIPLDRRSEETKILADLRKGKRIDHFETVRVRKDGTEFDISLTISPLKDHAGNVVGASKVARDITGRKRTEKALRDTENQLRTLAGSLESQVHLRTQELEERNTEIAQQAEQLRELSNRVQRTQDDERRRIARDLHDSAGQVVTALTMHLASITQGAADPKVRKVAEESQEMLGQLGKEIRTISYLLHPPLLDENGLPGALRWYTDGLVQRSGLKIVLDISADFGRLPDAIEVAIFRIVQECLTNVHRHSGAKTATIRLETDVSTVLLEIRDDGSGIPKNILARILTQRSGVGMAGMRERVRHLHGELDIQSDSTGTTVSIRLPVVTDSAGDIALADSAASGSADVAAQTATPFVQILIVDDNEMVRRGVKALLSSSSTCAVCGEASNGKEALAKARQLQPNLILLDINMPGSKGFEIAVAMRREFPIAKIIILSQHDKGQLLPGALEAGADACIDKNNLSTELLSTIHNVIGNAHAVGPIRSIVSESGAPSL